MANLAIKGHPTRGKEVIKILEMLGGVNKYEIPTAKEDLLYTIRSHDKFIIAVYPTNTFVVFTIEEFLEKFPYKVGDKALFYGDPVFITKIEWIEWIEDSVAYHFYYNGRELIAPAKHLQPYKEETMEEIKIDIPKGYEFARVDDDNQQVVFEKISRQYPKTYEECCKILKATHVEWFGYYGEVLVLFQKLIICRDAYWKIAGEQMGFGKPWKPDFKDDSDKYFICYVKDEVWKSNIRDCNKVLVFPTEEMRDAFYENFKDLIIECMEFL